jgi:hypothetical protein
MPPGEISHGVYTDVELAEIHLRQYLRSHGRSDWQSLSFRDLLVGALLAHEDELWTVRKST